MGFRHDIRVRWADCDPARIVYTANIPALALEALDAWWENAVGLDWFRLNVERNVGTPFVHLSVDFHSPVTPLHILNCDVSLLRVGVSSVRFRVIGSQNGTKCFTGEFVEVFVASQEHSKIEIPDDMRPKLEALLEA